MIMKLLISFLFIFTCTLGFTQSPVNSDKLPNAVRKSFYDKYPDATDIIWNKTPTKSYDVIFSRTGTAYTARLSKDGRWLETRREVTASNLPVMVQGTLAFHFPEFAVIKAVEVITPTAGTNYELELVSSSAKYNLLMSAGGELLLKVIADDLEVLGEYIPR